MLAAKATTMMASMAAEARIGGSAPDCARLSMKATLKVGTHTAEPTSNDAHDAHDAQS